MMTENMGGTSFMNTYHSNENKNSDYHKILDELEEHAVADIKKRPKYDSSKMKITESDKANMLRPGGLLSSAEDMLSNRFNKFSRYGYLDPSGEFVTGAREYLFFSKPDLHLIDVNYNPHVINKAFDYSPFFTEAFNRYKLSYYSLQQTFPNGSGKTLITDGLNIDLKTLYIPLLSNMVTSTLDLPDVTAGEMLNNQNLYQINTSYREGSITSDIQYDFSLEFKDTKYLDVYMLFKIYDQYFRQKYDTEILPTKMDYIFNKIYPEALSIWKIIVDDTGRIMYWAKATGCTPMSVPRSTISNIEGNIKFTVNWKAQFIRDMDPINLLELNYLTACSLDIYGSNINSRVKEVTKRAKSIVEEKIGDDTINMNGSTWVGYPYIMEDSNTSPMRTGHYGNPKSSGFHRLIWLNP